MSRAMSRAMSLSLSRARPRRMSRCTSSSRSHRAPDRDRSWPVGAPLKMDSMSKSRGDASMQSTSSADMDSVCCALSIRPADRPLLPHRRGRPTVADRLWLPLLPLPLLPAFCLPLPLLCAEPGGRLRL